MENWLTCNVGIGQLAGEYMVEGFTSDGVRFTLFAQAEFVEANQQINGWQLVPGRLKVQVLGAEDGKTWIRLPAESYELGYVVRVNRSQMSSSEALQTV